MPDSLVRNQDTHLLWTNPVTHIVCYPRLKTWATLIQKLESSATHSNLPVHIGKFDPWIWQCNLYQLDNVPGDFQNVALDFVLFFNPGCQSLVFSNNFSWLESLLWIVTWLDKQWNTWDLTRTCLWLGATYYVILFLHSIPHIMVP